MSAARRLTTRASLAPLRSRDFRFYYASTVVNLVGTSMASVALAFAVLAITDDPAALGYVLAAHTVPMVVLLLWGGVLADRFPRTVVIQVSNLASALAQGVLAGLVVTRSAELWMLVVLSLVHGTVSAAAFPALAGLVPQLVPRDQLQPANALMSLARGSLTVIGPTTAAALVVGVGPGWALAVDAATWLVAAALLGPVRLPARPPRDASSPSIWQDLRAGWTPVRGTTWLWVVVAGFGLLNAIHAGAWFTLGPARAQGTIGEAGWGLVLSAEAAGLLLTTLVLLRVRLERPLAAGMLGVALVGPPIVALGAAPHLGLLLVLALLAGAGTEVFSLGWNLALQEHVPEEMLSRAYSYDALGSFVAIPVGQVVAGPLAAVVGFRAVMVGGGLTYVALCLVVLAVPAVRRLTRVPPGASDGPAVTPSAPATS